MQKLKKAIVGTAAATAMAVSATPAMARDNDRGIGTGEVIAGAVVLGGLAAILSSGRDKDRYDYRRGDRYRGDYGDRGDYGRGYHRGRHGARNAVDRCVRVAERRASRRYGWADVTQIRDVERTRYGYRVKGRIVVQDRAWGGRYDRRYGRNIDRGKFTCYFDGRGRPQIDFDNLDRSRRY